MNLLQLENNSCQLANLAGIGNGHWVDHAGRPPFKFFCNGPPRLLIRAWLQPEVERQLTKMLELGLIRESDSDVSSPLVLVRKKDGSIRLCVSYVALNESIEMDHYGAANPDDILSHSAGSRFISTIDIRSAYYQVSMTEDSKKYTVFRSLSGILFEFQVKPMGQKSVRWCGRDLWIAY